MEIKITSKEQLVEHIALGEKEFLLTSAIDFADVGFFPNVRYSFKADEESPVTLSFTGYEVPENVILEFHNFTFSGSSAIFVFKNKGATVSCDKCTFTGAPFSIQTNMPGTNSFPGFAQIYNSTLTNPIEIKKSDLYVAGMPFNVYVTNCEHGDYLAVSDIQEVNTGVVSGNSSYVNVHLNGELANSSLIQYAIEVKTATEFLDVLEKVGDATAKGIVINVDAAVTTIPHFTLKKYYYMAHKITINLAGALTVEGVMDIFNAELEINGNITVNGYAIVDRYSHVVVNGTLTADGSPITSPICNFDSRIKEAAIGSDGGNSGGEMTNAVVQEYIDTFGDRIFEFMFDNSYAVFVGYPSSKVLSVNDIILKNVAGTDMIGFRNYAPHTPDKRQGATFVVWHVTSCLQWIGVMDEDYADLRIDPLILK